MIPLGDHPNPREPPLVTFALILANVAVYLFFTMPLGDVAASPGDPLFGPYLEMLRHRMPNGMPLPPGFGTPSAYDLFVFAHGYKATAPALDDLLFSLFLHADLMHLVGNMLFLWIYGNNVESRLGWWRYLAAYFGTGIFASLLHAFLQFHSSVPLIGASGAISGILGLYCIWFPRNRVELLLIFFPFLFRRVEVGARSFILFYLVFDNLLPFLTEGIQATSGVAYDAHLGGFLAGSVVAWIVRERQQTAAEATVRVEERLPAYDNIEQLVKVRKFEAAADRYLSLPEQATRVLSPGSSLLLGEYLQNNRRPAAALTVFRRHVRDYPAGPGLAPAHIRSGEIEFQIGKLASAYQHFLDGLKSNPSPEEAAIAHHAMTTIEGIQARAKQS